MEKHLKAVVGSIGTYQVIFKSGATVVLENVELVQYGSSNEGSSSWVFERNGRKISFTPHLKASASGGEMPLDDVIDAILHLK